VVGQANRTTRGVAFHLIHAGTGFEPAVPQDNGPDLVRLADGRCVEFFRDNLWQHTPLVDHEVLDKGDRTKKRAHPSHSF
jgi:hypothetical protein